MGIPPSANRALDPTKKSVHNTSKRRAAVPLFPRVYWVLVGLDLDPVILESVGFGPPDRLP